jgi:hypothetical protein
LVTGTSLESVTGAPWVLSDVAALVGALVDDPAGSVDAHMALMDAFDLVPAWATHCMVFALAEKSRQVTAGNEEHVDE